MSHELAAVGMDVLAASRLSGGGFRVWCALNLLQTQGRPLTIERVMEVTGLSRAHVYTARNDLETVVRDSRNVNRDIRPLTSDVVIQESEIPDKSLELERATVHTIVHNQGVNGDEPPPLWQQAVTNAAANVDITKSRDLFHEVFAPAYDVVRGEIGECIGLAAGYVETATGERLSNDDRKKIALLVRTYGKAGVFGIHQALGITETSTDLLRYARATATRIVRENRP